jgi:hypothetical protein
MNNAQFYVLKENVAKFIEAVKPQTTFNVEDMGEYYSIFFNCGADVENAQAAVEEIEVFKEYMFSGSLEEHKDVC